ncbi:TIGR00730 family Rossman fold protein [bacterium]|nr:TIGR00730 family Rossman fold protein [bacterium]MCI0603957.1 TIGR00730 family Rossman fold protein [bacterium]
MARRRRRDRDPEVDQVIMQLWNVIDDLERLLPSQSRWFRVTIFGSSRIARGDALYNSAKDLAFQLTQLGCDIVTGGGPGLMEAANEGAQAGDLTGKTKSIGLHIELPFEYKPNPYIDRLSSHRTFFSRLHHFVRLSHAYIVLPGGIGTSLETFMIWQLLQVGYIKDRPLILLGDMWKGLVEWMNKEMVPRQYVAADDLNYVRAVSSIEEALRVVKVAKERFERSMDVLYAAGGPS